VLELPALARRCSASVSRPVAIAHDENAISRDGGMSSDLELRSPCARGRGSLCVLALRKDLKRTSPV
jgi:hypothetical protein